MLIDKINLAGVTRPYEFKNKASKEQNKSDAG